MRCIYSEHGICQLATRLANTPVIKSDAACIKCQLDKVPMSVNCITASIAANAQMRAGLPINRDLLRMATGRFDLAGYKVERYIHKWLNRLKITMPANCGCESWVKKMNKWGVQESLNHLDEITEAIQLNLQQIYLAGHTLAFLTKPIIKNRIRSCLLKKPS